MDTKSLRHRSFLRYLLAAIAVVAFTAVTASAARFGTMCQENYQNGWQHTLPYVWERCAYFNNELDDTDTKVFYYSLVGAKPTWENTSDQYYLDNVDLFYGSTHGGAWSTASVWAMYDQNQLAYSSSMRLGDEANRLSIFSTYSCETLKFNDGKLWLRMGPIFRGGLRYATGSYDTFWDGLTTDETGEDYADNLQAGYSIKYSWSDGNSDWWVDNDIAVMATGTNSTNCFSRLDGMTWRNFTAYPRLMDAQIGYYCYRYWSQ